MPALVVHFASGAEGERGRVLVNESGKLSFASAKSPDTIAACRPPFENREGWGSPNGARANKRRKGKVGQPAITNIRTNQQGLMERIWKLVIEILVEPGDMPSGLTKGFMNVTTWADSAESARDKLDKYIERFKWHVISIEDARPIADDEQFEDESMEDMIARTRTNPNAIILGTFHGYKEN